MSDLEAGSAPVQEAPPPLAVEEQAPPLEATPELVDDDPLEPELAAQVIDIPDGDKLVPLSALTKTRAKAKEFKAKAEQTDALAAELAQLKQKASEPNAIVQAAQALLAAQQQQQPPPPQQSQGQTPEEIARLEQFARNYDLYKPDGMPDLDRAFRIKQEHQQEARSIAQQEVQPLIDRTLQQDAAAMLRLAKQTKLPDGSAPDPAVLDELATRIAKQPGGMQTLADKEAMRQLYFVALGMTQGKRAMAPKPAAAVAEPLPAPVFSEKSGGKASDQRGLSSMETKAAKDLGMTHSEYLKLAATKPW